MFLKDKKSPNSIRELNNKVSRYKDWWRDRRNQSGSPTKKQKGSPFSKMSTVDDSFVYYEEN